MTATLSRLRRQTNPIAQWLLDHNQAQSQTFISAEQRARRAEFRLQHPTEFLVFKCMDGRLNLSVLANIPFGIITPFRNIGGEFDLGWPYLSHTLLSHINYLSHNDKKAFLIFTYHFSKGSRERGCKGFDYDTERAKRAAEGMRKDAEVVFARSTVTLCPIVIGIETDDCALIFHGKDGSTVHVGEWLSSSDEHEMMTALSSLYPDLGDRMLADLFMLFRGNLQYMRSRSRSGEEIIELDHKEQVICIGRGFDWLHTPNLALIIGPYGTNLEKPVEKAAGILLDNLLDGRIPKHEGVLLVAAAPFMEESLGIEESLAFLKAKTLAELAMQTIHDRVPNLEKHITCLVGTTDMRNRFFRNHTDRCCP
jgi:hypothetical protein